MNKKNHSDKSTIFCMRLGKVAGSPTHDDQKLMEPLHFLNNSAPNNIGILYVHGFTSTPRSMRLLADTFKDRVRYTAIPLLPGHGTSPQDLKTTTHHDWFESVKKAYLSMQEHCNEVITIGQSMGALLATQLAHEHPEINQLVFLVPAFYPPALLKLSPILSPLLASIGVQYLPVLGGDIKNPSNYEITYKKVPVSSYVELNSLCSLARKLLPTLNQRITVIGSKHDHVLPKKGIISTFNEITSEKKSLHWVNNSYHVTSVDNDLPELITLIERRIFS